MLHHLHQPTILVTTGEREASLAEFGSKSGGELGVSLRLFGFKLRQQPIEYGDTALHAGGHPTSLPDRTTRRTRCGLL
jgi:hypothetical protein